MFDFTPVETGHWLAASGIVASYAAFCWQQFRRSRPSTRSTVADKEAVLVVFASQTGQAEALARQTAQALATDKRSVQLYRIEENWQAAAPSARCVLFVASTYGEGSAPDHALRFVQAKMNAAESAALRGVRYGVLALGDSSYQAFCGFGRQLDAWLQAAGATAQFTRIEADRLDAGALSAWQQQLTRLGAKSPTISASKEPDYAPWQFVERRCLNTGSPGGSICMVVLQPAADAPAHWQAGDLVDILIPGGDGHPRAYSIANLPGDGRVELIVRKHIRDDGQTGQTSGWLTEQAQAGNALQLKFRSNPSFHLEQDLSRPLILIGSGAGIAGLRSHLQNRQALIAASGEPAPSRSAWLFFGERSGRHDHLCKIEIEAWQQARVLSKINMAFSRDDPVTPYVQHSLLVQAKEISEWVEAGAQILICGNAKKMAPGVDKALRQILGSAEVDTLLEAGRIRRDVF